MSNVMVGSLVGAGEPHIDPDAQATVTDFLDQTEHLPSDLTRSLTLIGKLDDLCYNNIEALNDKLKVYGTLPRTSDKRAAAQEAQGSRKQLSYTLDLVLHRRAAAYVESSRLAVELDRHHSRLTSIAAKLHALPKPPSRESTPQPTAQSPQATRKQSARLIDQK